jgi:HSP20 family protein
MATQALSKTTERFPTVFEDFFKPWNELFDNGGSIWNRMMKVPAVNITETNTHFEVALAAPGLKKDDFKIDLDGNLLTISSEIEETKETKEKKYTRNEYNYSSFSRTFTLPEDVKREKIEAAYENGVLKLVMPKKEEAKKPAALHIAVK